MSGGSIQALYCNVDTKVKAGQIDPRPYQIAAGLDKAGLAAAMARLKAQSRSYPSESGFRAPRGPSEAAGHLPESARRVTQGLRTGADAGEAR